MSYKELPQENELWDFERSPIVEGVLSLIYTGIAQSGKEYTRYEMELDGGGVAKVFETFTLETIRKHCVVGDRIKITQIGMMPKRDGKGNFYTFKVERDEQEPSKQASYPGIIDNIGKKRNDYVNRQAAERGEMATAHISDTEDSRIDTKDIPF